MGTLGLSLLLSGCTAAVTGAPTLDRGGAGTGVAHAGTQDAGAVSADTQRQDGDASSLAAPTRVATGAVFDITIEVRAGESATLTMHLPEDGALIDAPDETAYDDGILAATVPASGEPYTGTIRWQAPSIPTVLTVRLEVAAGDVHDDLQAGIEVVDSAGVTVPIDYANMRGYLSGINLPTNPDDLTAECFAYDPLPIPTLDEAVRDVQEWVASEMPSGPSDWSGEELYTDSEGLKAAFVEAYLAGSVGMMMVLALRGHELDPGDGAHLLNAGTAANLIEEPETALAFLTAASGLPLGASDGMPQQAVLLNNLADAHAMRGDWDDAVLLLQQALEVDPGNLLLERQLAENLVCAGRKGEALDHLRAGYRNDDTADEVVLESAQPAVSHPDADRIVDMTPAQEFGLAATSVPPTWEKLLGATDRAKAERDAAAAMENALRSQFSAQWSTLLSDDHAEPAAHRRQTDLVLLVGSPHADSAVMDAADVLRAAADALEAFCAGEAMCLAGGAPPVRSEADIPTCADHRQTFAQWRERAGAYEAALNAYYRAAWPVWTALQGNLADPQAYDLAGLQLKIALAGYRVQAADAIANGGTGFTSLNGIAREFIPLDVPATCTDPAVWEDDEEDGEPGPAPRCTDDLKAAGFAFSIKILTIKITCDTISVEMSTETPFLKGFAQWELGLAPGGYVRSSMVVGAKLELGIELEEGQAATAFGVGSFQSALYIEHDPTKRIKDIGWVVGPETEISFGPSRFKVADDKIKMSILTISGGMDLPR